MLSVEQDDRLKAVGPGTPMGELFRRYWQPVAAVAQLDSQPVMPVKLLGEALVLYRDGSGRLGLLAESCPHRRTSLAYGIPEDNGLRCPYHGWLYDIEGRCIDQPSEPAGSTFAEHITTTAYPVRALGGLIFAYLGPEPAPELPHYNVLVWNHTARETNGTVIPCNWLQVLENILDPVHVEHLHGRYFGYVLDRSDPEEAAMFRARFAPGRMKRIAFDLFEHGIVERHMNRDESEHAWTAGSAIFFPATAMVGSSDRSGSLIYIVPQDDEHTWFLLHMARPSQRPQETAPFYEVPGLDDQGHYLTSTANGQDNMVVSTQGTLASRDLEHLGSSDLGIIMYRQLLLDQMTLLEDGGEPMNVLRGGDKNRRIDLPTRPRGSQGTREVLIQV